MKFLFVGGSNTLMLKGYVHHFKYLYEKFIGNDLNIRNIAVGANSSVHGVELLKNESELSSYDCIFVEYVINDYKLAEDQAIQTWRQAYEGLLRYLIKNSSPHTRIINIVLGRRDSKTFPRLKKLGEEIEAYVKKYSPHANIEVLDVTTTLMQMSENKPDVYASLYQDDAHYSVPLGASLVGSLLLNHYTTTKPDSTPRLSGELPESDSFENSVVIDAAEFSKARKNFQNSRVSLVAAALKPGESIELEIPGSLIAFSYVSTYDCLSVVVSEEGEEPFLIDCRHEWPKKDKSLFMLKNLPLDWKSWPDTAEKRKLRFTAIAEVNRRASGAKKYIQQHNISAPDPTPIEGACFYLTTLLAKQ